MTDELWRRSAVDLGQAIAQGAVSSEDATRSVLGRIETVNPQVNAIVDLMADEALQAAREICEDEERQAQTTVNLLNETMDELEDK